jgi:pimeloyl-ACP methyl ester carboxylesterase
MHLDVTGSGPAVVFTHGFADDSTTFDGLTALLAPEHRVYRWDLPGHGRSGVESAPATRRTALRWLDAVVRSVGEGPAVLVGHSLGGYLSLCRAVLDPNGVAGLVLLATGRGYRKASKRAEWNAFIADYASTRGVDPLARGLGLQPDSLVLDGLSAIDLPVLVMVGGDDRRYHPGSRVIAAEVPGADLVVIDGAGHFPHRSHAAEMHRHVRDFLTRTAAC